MKTAQRFLFLVLLLTTVSTFANEVQQSASIKVVDSKFGNLFVFKVGKEFKGAMIEVFYSNGDLVASKSLSKRKMIINFCDVKSGTYTIRVTKDDRTEEFTYFRK